MQDLKWSATEKIIARKAFNLALEWELQAVILEAKSMAAKIQKPSSLWDLEQYLTQRRREIDRIYDYRYSVLPNKSSGTCRVSEYCDAGILHGLSIEALPHDHHL